MSLRPLINQCLAVEEGVRCTDHPTAGQCLCPYHQLLRDADGRFDIAIVPLSEFIMPEEE